MSLSGGVGGEAGWKHTETHEFSSCILMIPERPREPKHRPVPTSRWASTVVGMTCHSSPSLVEGRPRPRISCSSSW